MSTLAAALEYAERGLAVLPLRARDKRPHAEVLKDIYGSPKWGGLRRRPASAPEIRAWFEADPSANIGIITGGASGGLVVVDVDRPARFDGTHPPTPTVMTGRGRHLYFLADGEMRTQSHSWGELRAEGAYVVAPPSRHPGGAAYEWSIGLADAPLAALDELRLYSSAGGLSRGRNIPTSGESGESLETPSGKSYERARGTGDQLATIDTAVAAALPVLGINAPLGSSFRCVIPGHADRRPSASLFRQRDGVWRYRDWHGEVHEWWTLAEVRHAQVSGQLTRLDPPTLARWYRRLFAEAGVVDLAPVELPPLPPGTPAYVEQVRRGYQLLAAVRDGQGATEPMPFTRRFAASWCGVTEHEAREAIAELRRLGIIEKVGEHPAGARRMNLYRPGPGPNALRRGQREVPDRELVGSPE